MDKRVEENLRVKNQIAKAYFSLLKQRSVAEAENISVTAITERAGVSRMAYYRNFSRKTEIVEFYVQETVWSELEKRLNENTPFWSVEYGILFFSVLKDNRDLFLLLEQHGYLGLLLESFNAKNEELAGDMPRGSIERYNLYYAAGASLNAAMIWLREGCRESTRTMAESFCRFAISSNKSFH